MKKKNILIMLIASMCMLLHISAYANEFSWENVSGTHGESILLPANELLSRDEYRTVARGDFLSAGATEIRNGQDGSMTICIDTYAHHDVDSIFHTVFLDQWDEDDQDWYQVGYWDFVQTKEETEDGSLHELITIMRVTGYPTGKYYRLRGLHGVEYNDEIEATATETNGVLITDGPT